MSPVTSLRIGLQLLLIASLSTVLINHRLYFILGCPLAVFPSLIYAFLLYLMDITIKVNGCVVRNGTVCSKNTLLCNLAIPFMSQRLQCGQRLDNQWPFCQFFQLIILLLFLSFSFTIRNLPFTNSLLNSSLCSSIFGGFCLVQPPS